VPFRDLFAVVFFVSVGMLVNPFYLFANAGYVLALAAMIVFGKALITILMGFVLPASAHTVLVVAAGLSQIGEFSFIVGQTGVALGVLSQDQYSLILAGALLSIVLNPLLFRLLPVVERLLQRSPALWRRLDRQGTVPSVGDHDLHDHVVVVGFGRVGEHVVTVLEQLEIPRLVVESDARRAAEFEQRGIPTLYGDAANSEILNHADLDHARVLVVTLPDEAATEMVVAAARLLAPHLPIIARATTSPGVQRLHELGAQDVIHPELEGGLEVVRHTLLALDFPVSQVHHYTDAVRRDQYDAAVASPAKHQLLEQLHNTMRGMEIAWRSLEADNPLIGKSLAATNLRAQTGASVIALIREQELLPNPPPDTQLQLNDMLGLIGSTEQIALFDQRLATQTIAQVSTAGGVVAEQALETGFTGDQGIPNHASAA